MFIIDRIEMTVAIEIEIESNKIKQNNTNNL